jgi:hypothetical protein
MSDTLDLARLVEWSKLHSNVTPLDGTDRDSPTFGELRAALSRISELESALRPFAEKPTIEEIVKSQVPNDWAEASVERRIEMMVERKRANDAAILKARNVLGEKA